jgi:hypothetical protein
MAAQAATGDPGESNGTLTGGSVSATTPGFGAFTATLGGIDQTTAAVQVNAWSVTDATGSGKGYTVKVTATNPTVDLSAGLTDPGEIAAAAVTASAVKLVLRGKAALPGTDNSANAGDGPTVDTAYTQLAPVSAFTIQDAAVSKGMGLWAIAADTAGLKATIPSDAKAGAYHSTVTFTSAQKA